MTVPAPAALPSSDRLRELRASVRKWQEGSRFPEQLMTEIACGDLVPLLDCAIAIRRLEEWLSESPMNYVRDMGTFDGELIGVRLIDRVAAEVNASGPTLLAALVRALEQTTEKT